MKKVCSKSTFGKEGFTFVKKQTKMNRGKGVEPICTFAL